MLSKNHKILNEREKIKKNKEKLIRFFPEMYSNKELQLELDNKNELTQHGNFLLDYIKTQNKEKGVSSDTKKKLEAPLKQLLK
tara:strand:+ start:249 stop:497 length:249 start_codon:yes stop_codon:yes gene_type:complete